MLLGITPAHIVSEFEEQILLAVALLRGLGVAAVKSVELLFASVQPFDALKILVVLLVPGAYDDPS